MKSSAVRVFAEIFITIIITQAFKVFFNGISNHLIYLDHFMLYQQKSLDEKGVVFLDPNTFSEDGTTALSQTAFTQDGEIFAYGISEKGSDWVTVKVTRVSLIS